MQMQSVGALCIVNNDSDINNNDDRDHYNTNKSQLLNNKSQLLTKLFPAPVQGAGLDDLVSPLSTPKIYECAHSGFTRGRAS